MLSFFGTMHNKTNPKITAQANLQTIMQQTQPQRLTAYTDTGTGCNGKIWKYFTVAQCSLLYIREKNKKKDIYILYYIYLFNFFLFCFPLYKSGSVCFFVSFSSNKINKKPGVANRRGGGVGFNRNI